jgi:mannose-1-phosphate guanylyltransferase
MLQSGLVLDAPLAAADSTRPEEGCLWAIVLAGGDGQRLAPLIRQLYGDERPKQYAALIGSRSLLRQTLDRVGVLVPCQRTVVVTMASHARYLDTELVDFPDVHVLAQPADRGTVAAVLLAALWIRSLDRRARVVVFPADHFVLDEAAFMRHVREVTDYVDRVPRWLVLLGARPAAPDADYGWIEPGERIGHLSGGAIHRVLRFRETPVPDLAHALFANGSLWNTFVFASTVVGLIDAVRLCCPWVYDPLVDRRATLQRAYLQARAADFSCTVLQSPALSLAVSEMPDVAWRHLGSLERVADVLRSLGTGRRLSGADDRLSASPPSSTADRRHANHRPTPG